jgi:NACalpha-BTF3-like transcription factor
LLSLTEAQIGAAHVKPNAFRLRGSNWEEQTQKAFDDIGRSDVKVVVPRQKVQKEQALRWLKSAVQRKLDAMARGARANA